MSVAATTPDDECPQCHGVGKVEGDLVDDDTGEVIESNAPAVRCDMCDGSGEIDKEESEPVLRGRRDE